MAWRGAYRIGSYIDTSIEDGHDWPPEHSGVYVVSVKRWRGQPTRRSGVLYIGGNTGRSDRFRTRIGDLLADMLGFFGQSTGHHSGGQSLWTWCVENRVNPLDLYLGWRTGVRCKRCAEARLFRDLQPLLNKHRPSRCAEHG